LSATRLAARLPGRRAFITGGGSGLGLALATQLARDGWTIGLLDRERDRLETAARLLNDAGAAAVHTFVADVTDERSFGGAVEGFVERAGGLDFMVNNAGVAVAGSVAETPLADWRWALEINVVGVALGSRFALPAMQRADRGLILNIASAAAFAAAPGMSAYNASKAAVVALTETLAAELYGTGVHAMVAMPGFFPTRLLDTMRAPADGLSMARKLMDKSAYTAEMVAAEMLAGAAAGELYLVLPPEYARLWRLKRWWPSFFMRRLGKMRARAAARRASRA
jgi:NAD(P)-dependent dehydrogenase (short-subunit alcohol dehydrogenase family)